LRSEFSAGRSGHHGDGMRERTGDELLAVGAGEIAIRSPLVLLEEDELDFYRSRAVALSSLRGCGVERRGRGVGTLRDVVIALDGELRAVVVDADGGTERLRFDGALRFAPESRSAA
jgi:hypothetical protein